VLLPDAPGPRAASAGIQGGLGELLSDIEAPALSPGGARPQAEEGFVCGRARSGEFLSGSEAPALPPDAPRSRAASAGIQGGPEELLSDSQTPALQPDAARSPVASAGIQGGSDSEVPALPPDSAWPRARKHLSRLSVTGNHLSRLSVTGQEGMRKVAQAMHGRRGQRAGDVNTMAGHDLIIALVIFLNVILSVFSLRLELWRWTFAAVIVFDVLAQLRKAGGPLRTKKYFSVDFTVAAAHCCDLVVSGIAPLSEVIALPSEVLSAFRLCMAMQVVRLGRVASRQFMLREIGLLSAMGDACLKSMALMLTAFFVALLFGSLLMQELMRDLCSQDTESSPALCSLVGNFSAVLLHICASSFGGLDWLELICLLASVDQLAAAVYALILVFFRLWGVACAAAIAAQAWHYATEEEKKRNIVSISSRERQRCFEKCCEIFEDTLKSKMIAGGNEY